MAGAAAAEDSSHRRTRRRRGVALAVAVLVLLLALGPAVLSGLQRRLVYFPAQDVRPLPGWVEEVTTTTADDLDLRGWLVRDDATQPLVLVLHGNGGTAADRLPLAEALRGRGIATLLAEYRGYAGNPGTPSEAGLQADATAWAAWAATTHDGPLTYLGESLGAAVAVHLAVANPPAALVLRSPFTSLADVGRVHLPLLPLRLLLDDTYDVVGRVGEVDAPVLVVLGTDDTIVPPAQSRAVHRAAGDRAAILEVPAAGHNDRVLLDGDRMVEAIAALVDEVG